MRWPWQRRTEHRASFTDALINAFFVGATGTTARDAHETAALEACAALYASCFAVAKVEPETPAVTPACLALIGRNLIRQGADLHLVELDGGMVKLSPIGTWHVIGPPDPAAWRYRVDVFGPTDHVTRYVPAAAVLHCMYARDSVRPWLGVPPLGWASATASLAGGLERTLADESQAPSAQLVPIPADGGDGSTDDPLASLKSDIAAAKGRALLVETTQAGYGAGPTGAPKRDWQQSRIGFEPPDIARAVRSDVFQNVAAACNVPGVLLDPRAEGTSQREGLRRFAHLALEPLGALVAAELAAKLDRPGLVLDFAPLMASDLAGKARAIKGLVEAGLELPAAAAVAGLDS